MQQEPANKPASSAGDLNEQDEVAADVAHQEERESYVQGVQDGERPEHKTLQPPREY